MGHTGFCIRITLIWPARAEVRVSRSSWKWSRISLIEILADPFLGLVVVHSSRIRMLIKVCEDTDKGQGVRGLTFTFFFFFFYLKEDIPAVPYSSKGRRRSSCTPRPDPDEILKNLKAVKGELMGRSMSICSGDWRMRRSTWLPYGSIMPRIKIMKR